MAIQTYSLGLDGTTDTFMFTVPGAYTWRVLSVFAVAEQDNVAANIRSYVLTVTDGTNVVVAAPASDTLGGFADVNITWSNAATVNTTDRDMPWVMVPFPDYVLPPGYTLAGSFHDGDPSDVWLSATVWVDQKFT